MTRTPCLPSYLVPLAMLGMQPPSLMVLAPLLLSLASWRPVTTAYSPPASVLLLTTPLRQTTLGASTLTLMMKHCVPAIRPQWTVSWAHKVQQTEKPWCSLVDWMVSWPLGWWTKNISHLWHIHFFISSITLHLPALWWQTPDVASVAHTITVSKGCTQKPTKSTQPGPKAQL
jgi:hypothetical protein